MADVIRYLLLLNHPENSDFSGNTTFNQRIMMVVYFCSLIIYLFTIHLSNPPVSRN